MNRPPFNLALEQAMIELSASHTPERRMKTYEAVLGSELIVPLWNATDEARHFTAPLKPMWIGLPEANYLPAFTAWEAVKRWKHVTETPSFVIVRGQGVFVAACEVGSSWVWINPDGPIDMRISPTDILVLAKGAVPGPQIGPHTWHFEVKRDDIALLGPPIAAPPEALVADLRRALEDCPKIHRAFLFQASLGAGSELTLGVVFDGNTDSSTITGTVRSLGPALRAHKQDDDVLAVVVLDGKTLKSVQRDVKPFFKRADSAPRSWFRDRLRWK